MSSLVNAFASLFKGIGTTYSFKDLSGVITSPLAGAFPFAGDIGAGKVTIENITEHGTMETSADGTVLPSFIAGKSARITIECQQTSTMHKWLLVWANLHIGQANRGDISNWAGSTVLLRNTLDGSSHIALGVIPTKIPDKAYAQAPTMLTWTVLAANLNSL